MYVACSCLFTLIDFVLFAMRHVQSLSCSSKFRLSRLLAEWNLSVCAALLPRGLVSHVRIHWIAENSSRGISNSLNRERTRTSQWQSLGLIRLGSFLGSADGKIHEHFDGRQGCTIDDHIDGRRTLVSNLRHYRWPHRWTPGRHYRWPHRWTPTQERKQPHTEVHAWQLPFSFCSRAGGFYIFLRFCRELAKGCSWISYWVIFWYTSTPSGQL